MKNWWAEFVRLEAREAEDKESKVNDLTVSKNVLNTSSIDLACWKFRATFLA